MSNVGNSSRQQRRGQIQEALDQRRMSGAVALARSYFADLKMLGEEPSAEDSLAIATAIWPASKLHSADEKFARNLWIDGMNALLLDRQQDVLMDWMVRITRIFIENHQQDRSDYMLMHIDSFAPPTRYIEYQNLLDLFTGEFRGRDAKIIPFRPRRR